MARKKPQVKQPKYEMNLKQLIEQFPDDESCRRYLEGLRWPEGAVCPSCNCGDRITDLAGPPVERYACNYIFSVTSDTALHDTHLPLRKWVLAVYLMTESEKGVSALQLKRSLHVAYKTACHLCHRIRLAMDEAKPSLLDDIVEADETLVGGKVKGEVARASGQQDHRCGRHRAWWQRPYCHRPARRQETPARLHP